MAQAFCLEGPLNSGETTPLTKGGRATEQAFWIWPQFSLSAPISQGLWPPAPLVSGWHPARVAQEPVLPLLGRRNNSKRRAHYTKGRTVPGSAPCSTQDPDVLPAPLPGCARVNQDPSCLRGRLRLRSWPRSGLVVWKREAPHCARSQPGLPTAGRRRPEAGVAPVGRRAVY